MSGLYLLFGFIFFSAVCVTWYVAKNAPYGYEDEEGFHLGKPE